MTKHEYNSFKEYFSNDFMPVKGIDKYINAQGKRVRKPDDLDPKTINEIMRDNNMPYILEEHIEDDTNSEHFGETYWIITELDLEYKIVSNLP